MGKRYPEINEDIREFIERQKIFFVATATSDSRINVSPKGGDTFRVIDKNSVIWLNLTGSGNETAAHIAEDGRMTIMFCAFEGKPMILRLYGSAQIYHGNDREFRIWSSLFPDLPGKRQIIRMHVDLVQTSCGMAVPLMDFRGERDELFRWAEKQGPERLKKYREEKNSTSLDGKEIKGGG